jgi:glycosyltransferase involved in cell wall biosynthesis
VAVLYVGAHGISHGLSSVVDAAAKLEGEGVRFVFVGEGATKRDLERQVAELALTNVTMLPGVQRDHVPALLHAADICLVPLRDVPLFSTFIPSKIFEYFAAGKAVVGSVRGEPAEILREGGATVVDPEDPAALAEAIRDLAQDPDRRARMGHEAEQYVRARFDRRALAADYRRLLEDLVGR